MTSLELFYIRLTLRPAFRWMHVAVDGPLSHRAGNHRGG
jgi:hypothetical protein